MVDLGGYVIVLVEKNGKIKLFGSAAERSDCDEILEINGISMDNATHGEIIQHIHQCIKTRTICLRVKRRASGKLGNSIDSSLIDAFVIGSRAREHLQQITRDANITPRDIAQLSKILSENGECDTSISNANQPKSSFNSASKMGDIRGSVQWAPEVPTKTESINGQKTNQNISSNHKKQSHMFKDEPSNLNQPSFHRKLKQCDSGDIDYLELADENMQLLNLAPDRTILSKTDSQQSIVDIVKQSVRSLGSNGCLDDFPQSKEKSFNAVCPVIERAITVEHLEQSLRRLLSNLNDKNLNHLIQKANLLQLLQLYEKLMQEQNRLKFRTRYETGQLIQQVINLLQSNENMPSNVFIETQELLEILTKFEMEGVCSAFDHLLHTLASVPFETELEESIDVSEVKAKDAKTTQADKPEDLQPPPVPPLPQSFPSTDPTISTSSTVNGLNAISHVSFQPTLIPLQGYQMSTSGSLPTNMGAVYPQPSPLYMSATPVAYGPSYTEIGNVITPLSHSLQTGVALPAMSVQQLVGKPVVSTVAYLTSPALGSVVSTGSFTSPLVQTMTPSVAGTQPLNNIIPSAGSLALPPISRLSIVRVEKQSSEPLGATVRNEPDGRVTIGRIVCGGAAEKCAALREGDELLMVNNVYIRGKDVNQVCELLSQMEGTLTFVIAKNESNNLAGTNVPSVAPETTPSAPSTPKVTHYKAFFDYDPHQDIYIPCRELGIAFRKGDILHVLDSRDQGWWQAYREGDTLQNLAGLIPSLHFQKQRQDNEKAQAQTSGSQNQHSSDEDDVSLQDARSAQSTLFNCGKKSAAKKKKHRRDGNEHVYEPISNAIPYEEMVLATGHRRTVVLVGPNHIGRQQLRERLLNLRSSFAAAIPHTSRQQRNDEQDGIDYHFVNKTLFEQMIKEGKFIEYGDYDKNYYGTSFSSVQSVLSLNRTCVLNLHVHSIHKLRTPEVGVRLKPFFVFVSPPKSLDKLRKLIESINSLTMSQNELQSILEDAQAMEAAYSPYFDLMLTVNDLERTFGGLLAEVRSLDKEPQWIPANWIR